METSARVSAVVEENAPEVARMEGLLRGPGDPGDPDVPHDSDEPNSYKYKQAFYYSEDPKRENPWKQETMICFDGGGIRGYASLRILEKLMARIQHYELNPGQLDPTLFPLMIPQPCHTASFLPSDGGEAGEQEGVNSYLPAHYFDYFFGTSTGGLIAIMLGRFRMSIGECLDRYKSMGPIIFNPKHVRAHPRSYKWEENGLEDEIRGVTYDHTPLQPRPSPEFSQFTNIKSPPDLNRVGLISYQLWPLLKRFFFWPWTQKQPCILRSYRAYTHGGPIRLQPHEPDRNDRAEIWQVCRATTAAPTYFRPQDIETCGYSPNSPIEPGRRWYIDGGFGTNNPTYRAWQEVESQSRDSNGQMIGPCPIVVSIGTGKPTQTPKLGLLRMLGDECMRRYGADTEETHQLMMLEVGHQHPDCYYRFNVQDGVGDIPMDSSNAQVFTDMDNFINTEYGPGDPNVANLDILAQRLVHNRRMRATVAHPRGQACWERFAKCNHFNCNIGGCGFNNGTEDHMTRHICQRIRRGYVHDVRSHTNREDLQQHFANAHIPADVSAHECGPFSSHGRGPW